MVGQKDVVGSQSRRSGFGKLVATHPPFSFISQYLRLFLKGVQKIRTTMNGKELVRKRECNTLWTAPRATHHAAHTTHRSTTLNNAPNTPRHTQHTTHPDHNNNTSRPHTHTRTFNVRSATSTTELGESGKR